MTECDICYDLFEYEPNLLRFEVGKFFKTPLILVLCSDCAREYDKLHLMSATSNIETHPMKLKSDQAIHQKVAISRKSIL